MNQKTSISEMRKRVGLTQSELADLVGVSEQTIANWEKGGAAKWIRNLTKLCSALGCDLSDLTTGIASGSVYQSSGLSQDMLSAIRRYCLAVQTNDEKAIMKIKSFIHLMAESGEYAWQYWLAKVNEIVSVKKDLKKNINAEEVVSTLIIQNLINQLSLISTNEITEEQFRDIVTENKLSDSFLKSYSSFDDDPKDKTDFVRKLVIQTNFLVMYVISWHPGQESKRHHHGNSLDILYVVEGEMEHWSADPEQVKKTSQVLSYADQYYDEADGDKNNAEDEGGEWKIARKGDFITIPRRHHHKIVNDSEKNLVTLTIRLGLPPDQEHWYQNSGEDTEDFSFEWQQAESYRLQKPFREM